MSWTKSPIVVIFFGTILLLQSFTIAGYSQESATTIPPWIKKNADWWAEDFISDREFATGLAFLIKENIIQVDNVDLDSEGSIVIDENITIDSWIKNNARWWADGQIDDASFKSGIEFMVKEGIISFKEKQGSSFSKGVDHTTDPELVKGIYKIQKQDELSMKRLLQIKNAETKILDDLSKKAWKDYSENKTQDTMNTASILDEVKNRINNETSQALQSYKTAVQLAEQTKAIALDLEIEESELDSLVSEEQQQIDSPIIHILTWDDLEEMYNRAFKEKDYVSVKMIVGQMQAYSSMTTPPGITNTQEEIESDDGIFVLGDNDSFVFQQIPMREGKCGNPSHVPVHTINGTVYCEHRYVLGNRSDWEYLSWYAGDDAFQNPQYDFVWKRKGDYAISSSPPVDQFGNPFQWPSDLSSADPRVYPDYYFIEQQKKEIKEAEERLNDYFVGLFKTAKILESDVNKQEQKLLGSLLDPDILFGHIILNKGSILDEVSPPTDNDSDGIPDMEEESFGTDPELECPEGQELFLGECVSTQCDPGYKMISGKCQQIQCDEGYKLVGNECQLESPPPSPPSPPPDDSESNTFAGTVEVYSIDGLLSGGFMKVGDDVSIGFTIKETLIPIVCTSSYCIYEIDSKAELTVLINGNESITAKCGLGVYDDILIDGQTFDTFAFYCPELAKALPNIGNIPHTELFFELKGDSSTITDASVMPTTTQIASFDSSLLDMAFLDPEDFQFKFVKAKNGGVSPVP